MMRKILLLVLLMVLGACKQVRKLSDVFTERTPRESYALSFNEGDSIYYHWNSAFESALHDSLQIDLPFTEVGDFSAVRYPIYTFNTQLEQGERVVVSVVSERDSLPVFIDIFGFGNRDSLQSKPLVSGKRFGQLPLEMEVGESGTYKILIQPELYTTADFRMGIYTEPTFSFPVADVSDSAIQSFWGAPRAGGKRSHKGVDIFAPRSTPVLAAVEGRIGYTGERGLGGKQVWLRDGILGKNLYYAHLDSIKVKTTNKVQVGDTLGFVGNSGNARTTVPHLHFGIYTGKGAVDPLPFIQRRKKEEHDLSIPTHNGFIATSKANVRLGPSTQAAKIAVLENRDTVAILGKTIDWYHIWHSGGKSGFVYHTLINEIDDVTASNSGL